MNEYTILLPNEKVKTYRIITVIVLLINFLVFGMLLIKATVPHTRTIVWGGMTMSTLSLVFFAINFYTKKLSFRTEISFILIALFWIMLGKYLVAAFIILFAITGFYTTRKPEVVFSASKIIYPSFPVKIFLWNEVSNVVLKDAVLTIDLKNNKLIQVVIEEGAEEMEEDAFNQFCRQQMNS